MKIGPTNNLENSPEQIQKKQIELRQQEPAREQKDSLEISQAGRDKLKELADSSLQEVGNDNEIIEQISPKAAKIRNKIEAGYYDLSHVQEIIIDIIAENMLDDINQNDRME